MKHRVRPILDTYKYNKENMNKERNDKLSLETEAFDHVEIAH